ncbi:MAG TPA: DUF4160 domain-containing protein [bacterium]|nr:DUF4160 domain-containing protein [bacterium]HPN42605.1 DUF4160 domain-containing protein [bacterium]
MPTVIRIGGYRFFFYAGDGNEPAYIHIERENNTCKFWLKPVMFCKSQGFNRNEINRIYHIVSENQELLVRSWNEYFND